MLQTFNRPHERGWTEIAREGLDAPVIENQGIGSDEAN